MTTAKQKAANKTNSQNSTGAKTPEGKAVVAGNALRHGLLSCKLILGGESQADYEALLAGLMQSLNPVGMLEQVLVEKIAVALWKHKRLVAAESASLELCRRMERHGNLKLVHDAMGMNWQTELSKDELQPLTEDDTEQAKWCSKVLAEVDTVPDEIYEACDYAGLKKKAPMMYEQLETDAEDEGMEVAAYLQAYDGNLAGWVVWQQEWCKEELAKIDRRGEVQQVAGLVKAQVSAPVNNELLGRYQAALDNELYRAIEALRKQQEWRSKGFIEAEAA